VCLAAAAVVCMSLFALPAIGAPAQSAASLPSTFGAWTASGPEAPAVDVRANPAVLQEYGFASATSRPYSRGPETLQVTLYRMSDATGAYGLYSYLRLPNFHRVDITEHSAMTPDRALILQGSLILDVSGKNIAASQPDFKNLAATLARASNAGPYPTLYGHLPQNGFVPDSDRYILGPTALHEFLPVGDGDWLGFPEGVEAEVANYRINGEELTLLIADFPTPQVAIKKMETWGSMFNVNGAQSGSDKPAVYVKRSLTLVGVVYRARSEAQAAALLSNVHSGTELTWNEPGFSFTDPGMGTVIVGIIYGTGFLCMFALVAGLAFGGVRLAVKRILPGRVFDRSAQLNVLQLGLGSKPINSDDFYGFGRPTRD
jgi:hypothetical protein